MNIMAELAIIFGICLVSEGISALLPIALPASVISMVLLFVLLATGGLKLDHIREKSDFLLANMSFFFLPAGVSMLNYFDVLKSTWVQLLVICLVTMVLVFAATALSVRFTLYLLERRKRHE